ncbi:MAG: hypothetical protein KBT69_00650 [Oceanihabitans sp.]|nr:hypothetical protein [Oceanihabitans sp.]
MKSLKIVSIFILSLFVFTITSCDDEPLEGEFVTDDGGSGVTCVEATQSLATASATYGTTATDDVSYSVVCNAYAVALQNMIDACGDDTGAIQTLLESLGCPAISDDCTTAQTATTNAETAYNADTTNTTLCTAYKAALQNEITECGDADGSLQTMIDGLNCTSTAESDYWPRAIGNSWTYNTFNSVIETYTITGMETIDGTEYFAFDQLYGYPSWIRKSGPNYYLRAQFSGDIAGIGFTATPFIINMIKDDAIIGETWESDVTYTINYDAAGVPDTEVNALYSFEMKERDITRTVSGENYSNVIHIELVTTAPGQSITSQYYYAKDVGMIDYEHPDGTNTLLEYTLN